MTLDEIFIANQTDKASSHPTGGHDYGWFYEAFFGYIRTRPIKLVEVGVGGAQSIKSWLDYFPNAQVFGVDNVQSTNPWNTVGEKPHPRYKFIWGDQSSEIFWKCFIADYGKDWDVFIDDGGHFANQVVTTFESMWPHVKAGGGLYCIEDLEAAYGAGTIFIPAGWPHHMDFIKTKLDGMQQGSNLKCFHLMKGLGIFEKA